MIRVPNDDSFGSPSPDGILSRMCWVCDNCDHPVCGVHRRATGFTDLFVWPETVAYRSYEDVPEAIASTASEAHQSLSAKARRAAVAMARATVEATAKDEGITRGNLQAKIEQLHVNGLISEDMKEAAHEVRFARPASPAAWANRRGMDAHVHQQTLRRCACSRARLTGRTGRRARGGSSRNSAVTGWTGYIPNTCMSSTQRCGRRASP